jgi:hypothetical protein
MDVATLRIAKILIDTVVSVVVETVANLARRDGRVRPPNSQNRGAAARDTKAHHRPQHYDLRQDRGRRQDVPSAQHVQSVFQKLTPCTQTPHDAQ